jgi:hypothetical protein
MDSSISLPKKCGSLFISAHGYQPVSDQEQTISMTTRSQSAIIYDELDVFHLSMAGLANVTTEMGIINKKVTDHGIDPISKYLTPKIVELLHKRSTEYATLTWLVHKIYGNQSDKSDKCKKNMVRLKLEELKEGMLVLEKLASIKYTEFSPPTIIKNPYFNKVYVLKPNPSEIIRRDSAHPDGGVVRSGFVRVSGNPKHNLFWAFYGLYMLDTSDKDHEYFSISKIKLDEHGFVPHQEITKRNLLTQKNYENFWKPYLDDRDFSDVPDSHVSNIGDDLEASVAIFKKFCNVTGIVNSVRRRKVALNHPLIEEHIETLRDAVTIAAATIREAIEKLHESANIVFDVRVEFKRTANLADKAEEKYNALLNRSKTRFISAIVEPTLHAEYTTAEAIWQQASNDLAQAKANNTAVNENAQQVKNFTSEVIIAAIKKCIDDIIISSHEHSELKKILKNIIMSNKLKNILKTGILNKKISSIQIILFFSGLGYQELGIADPACFVANPLKNPLEVDTVMQVDTQELGESSFNPPPLYEDILDFIEKELYHPMSSPTPISNKRRRISAASRSSADSRSSVASRTTRWGGGTKRKKLMRIYSRKRHARRRRYTKRRAS